jgi:hypothetical protein
MVEKITLFESQIADTVFSITVLTNMEYAILDRTKKLKVLYRLYPNLWTSTTFLAARKEEAGF